MDWGPLPSALDPEPEAPEEPKRFVSGMAAALELGTKEVKG